VNLKFIAAGALALVTVGAQRAKSQRGRSDLPLPDLLQVFNEYKQQNPSVQINYQPIGSAVVSGRSQKAQSIFGASDVTMTDEQLAAAKVKVIALPTVLGAVVPVYNIPGVSKELNFSGDVIADIYLGKIATWNDPRIAKDNPGVNLPNNAILPVYRSEGSGTTFIFTDFLSKVSPDFKSKVGAGAAVKWPTGIGQREMKVLPAWFAKRPTPLATSS